MFKNLLRQLSVSVCPDVDVAHGTRVRNIFSFEERDCSWHAKLMHLCMLAQREKVEKESRFGFCCTRDRAI